VVTDPDATWDRWWELNRWSFFPSRARVARRDAVTTPSGGNGIDREALLRERRALVRRGSAVPFLLLQLDPTRRVRDEVRAAALIATARLTRDAPAVALILHYLADARQAGVVRESAAYALGMLRRDDASLRMDGARLDAVRARLLETLDDTNAPVRTRAFAALATGLLADQPYGSPFTQDGRVISRQLWDRLLARHANLDIPVALLTALGMQPAAGTSQKIRDALGLVVAGRHVGRRPWNAVERSHALTALARQRGPGWALTLFRILAARHVTAPVRRSAFLALGAQAGDLDAGERRGAVDALERGLRKAHDPLTRGLGRIAQGRLLAAELAAGSSRLVEQGSTAGELLGEARHGTPDERGFAALGTALALRAHAPAVASVASFRSAALDALVRGFERTADARLRGAYAVALGLVGAEAAAAAPQLTAVVADRNADPTLRGRAAVALAQIGTDKTGGARKAIRTALWDRRSVELPSEAALALSFLGGAAETTMLVGELRRARSQWVLAQVAAALGQLGDVDAEPAILEVAADASRQDETRALAIASLGLVCDPGIRPSTLRLTSDANYPAAPPSLQEAFSIL
jgi:hypothetical protein